MLELKELLKMDIEDIISSVHSLTLLKLYSDLYMNGTEPRGCEDSQRKYYSQLKKDYQMKKQIIERTCVPKFEGRRYIPGVHNKDGKLIAGHLHVNGNILTDKQAIQFLNLGVLTKKDFIKLPKGFEEVKAETKAKDNKEAKPYTKDEIKELIEKDNYKKLSQAARDLGLIKTSANKEKTIEKLNDYLSKM